MSFELVEDSVTMGIKGPNAERWLAEQGISLPSLTNTWLIQQTSMVMRLGTSECMVAGPLAIQIQSSLENKPLGVYGVARADVSYLVGGESANALMAQVCALDVTQLSDEQVWMTQLAGVSVILIKTVAGYQFWCDVSYQAYLTETLNKIYSSTTGAK